VAIESSPQTPSTYKEQIALLQQSKGWLRLFGYLAALYLLTPILLGLVFMLMLFPLTVALFRLSLIFTPVYHLAGRIMGVKGLPERLARPPTCITVYSLVWAAVMLAIVAFCIRILFLTGFCNQNLICMFGPLLVK